MKITKVSDIMEKAKISVLLANYNHSAYLPESVAAILALQDYLYEFIICDDASTDESWNLLVELQRKNPFITLIRNEKNLGMLGNYTRLLQESTGTIVAMPAADDLWISEKMESLLRIIHENPVMGLYGGNNIIYSICEKRSWISREQMIPTGFYSGWHSAFRNALPWGAAGIFYNKKILMTYWDKLLPQHVFHDTCLHMLIAQYHNYYYLNDVVAIFQVHQDNLSQQYKESVIATKAQYDFLRDYPELYASMVKSKIYTTYFNYSFFLLIHPGCWDRYTLKILWQRFVAIQWRQLRHDIIPYLFPESVKKKYRHYRDQFLKKEESGKQ